MGHFDEIRWESELPFPEDLGEHADHDFSNEWWQTKSLLKRMDRYKVSANGNFWILRGSKDNKHWARYDHFGKVTFYLLRIGVKEDLYLVFDAKIDDGILRSVELSDQTFIRRRGLLTDQS